MTATVLILRGLPGSGKSTYARKRADEFLAEHDGTGLVSICSADQYPGLYNDAMEIDFSKLGDAHDWCFATFCEACEFASASQHLIIVDNTNTTLAEIAAYRMVARRHKLDVEFVEVGTKDGQGIDVEILAARNVHNVPARNIAAMRDRWQTLPPFWEKGTWTPPSPRLPIQVGDVVRTNYGYIGIVVSAKEETPDADWLHAQGDPRMREVPDGTRWFSVYPFEGGSVCAPETLTTRLRSMTADDFRKAYKKGNGFAKDELEEVFPQFAGDL